MERLEYTNVDHKLNYIISMTFHYVRVIGYKKNKGRNMKKITLTTIAALSITTGAMAANSSYPADGPDSYKATQDSQNTIQEQKDSNAAYIGIAYSYMNLNVDLDVPQFIVPALGFESDIQGDNLSIIGGYNFHEFLAVEGRYSKTMGDLDLSFSANGVDEGITWGGNMTNVGLYFKPNYTFPNSGFSLYALLGMGHVKLDLDNIGEISETEFQWGAGISIDGGDSIFGNSNIGLFIDYVRLYDKEAPLVATDLIVIDMVNVGFTFKF